MKLSLETVARIIADVLEQKDPVPVKLTDTFDDLGVDSLGLLMVIVGVAQELDIEGTEDQVVELVASLETVQDLIDYAASCPGT